jgi:hypothetical protein
MRSIVYLASYPRSGNTLLRALLANCESGLDRPLSAQAVAGYGFGEKSEPLWRASTGEGSARSLQAEWRARTRYQALCRTLPGEGPVMFKTHTLNGSAFDAPAFDIQPHDRIVYIVRHPFDVAVSAAHFFGLTPEAMAARMLLEGAFNDNGGYAPFEATGSWLQNVAGWLTEDRCPILLVRYADLVSDPGGELKRVLEFTAKPVSRERIAAAVDFSSFAWLQQSQLQEGFDQGPSRDPRATFFRVGSNDQWKGELPPAVIQSLDAALGELMEVLNFERPTWETTAAPAL